MSIEGEIVAELKRSQPAKANYDFVNLAEKIAGSLESAAQGQLNVAKEMLERTRAEAAALAEAIVKAAEERVAQAEKILQTVRQPATALRERIVKVDQELADLNARLQAFGESVLKAHYEFNDSEGSGGG
jgi:hypothetical protein